MAVALGAGGWLAWRLTARPTPAPVAEQSEPALESPSSEVQQLEPDRLAPPAPQQGRRRGDSCAAPRQFEASPMPYLVVEESQGEQRWYLRCPRPMQLADGTTTTLVRYQDRQGRTGLGVQTPDPAGGPGNLMPVLELDELASVDAELVGCAALSPVADDPRAWVSVQREDRSRVIHALRWQDGELVLDEDEPILRATQPWMKDRLWEPAVVRHGGEWLMYMRCGSRTRADLCLASSPDGQRWTVEPKRVFADIEAGKGEVYGAPWAVSEGGRVHLWFSHKRYETDEQGEVTGVEGEIHHLSSEDPRSFELRFRSVALAPGFSDWAATMVDTPTITELDGRTAMLFRGGLDAKDGSIGVAWGDCRARSHSSPILTTKSLKSTRKERGEGEGVSPPREGGAQDAP